MEIRIARQQLGFDCRDLAVAAVDSCSLLPPLRGDLLERASVAVQRRLLAAQGLPPANHDVHVLRIKLDAVADALG